MTTPAHIATLRDIMQVLMADLIAAIESGNEDQAQMHVREIASVAHTYTVESQILKEYTA